MMIMGCIRSSSDMTVKIKEEEEREKRQQHRLMRTYILELKRFAFARIQIFFCFDNRHPIFFGTGGDQGGGGRGERERERKKERNETLGH